MSEKRNDSSKNAHVKPKGKILIITGMSGAGKSQVIMALEDMGFFCVVICRQPFSLRLRRHDFGQ